MDSENIEKVEPQEQENEIEISQPQDQEKQIEPETEQLKKQIEEKEQKINEIEHQQFLSQLKDALPDPNSNPQEYAKALNDLEAALLRQEISEYKKQEQHSKLRSYLTQNSEAFAQEQSDYKQAMQALYDSRVQQYQASAVIDARMQDPNYVNNLIGQELEQICQICFDKQENPAKILYQIAKASGYKPTIVHDNTAKIEAINASKTLASTSSANTAKLTQEYLANLNDEEFEQLYTKNKQLIHKLNHRRI